MINNLRQQKNLKLNLYVFFSFIFFLTNKILKNKLLFKNI